MRGAVLGPWRLRKALIVTVVCAGVLGLAGPAQAAAPDPDLQLARTEAARVLAAVPLPAGTTTLPTDPFTGQPFAPAGPPEPWQVLGAGHWLAPVGALATRSYLSSHQPPGSTQTSISFGGGTLDWGETLTFPTSGVAVTSATLNVSVEPYGRSQTQIDASVQVLWKPAWEQIPATARALAVSVDRGPSEMVSGQRNIAAFARLFAGLSNVPPGLFSCPPGVDPATAVVRLVGAGRRTLGTVRIDDLGACNQVDLRLGRRRGAPLWDDGLLDLLWRERGVNTCRASQLTSAVTRASTHATAGRTASINIQVKNTSNTECSVDGYPKLRLLTPNGRPLAVRVARSHRQFPVSLATAAPGDALVITASWPKGRPPCPTRTIGSIALRMPGVSGELHASASDPVSVCRGPITISPVFNPGPFSAIYMQTHRRGESISARNRRDQSSRGGG
jgi:hypothetical protein